MQSAHAPQSRRGQVALLIGGALCLGAAALVTAAFFRGGAATPTDDKPELYTVKRGTFDIKIPASGELVALQQIEIRNQLPEQAVITQIAEEGKWANTGDVLLRFNDEQLRVKLNETTDEVNLAETAVAVATSELDVRNKERESELAKANLAVLLADLALQAWADKEHGEHTSKRQRLELAVETTGKSYERLKDRYETSAKLKEQEFISVDECRA